MKGRWHNQPHDAEAAGQAAAVAGVVKWFDADDGWGVVEAPEVPGGCFVHFSNIEMPRLPAAPGRSARAFHLRSARIPAGRFLLSCSDGMARGVTISGMRVRLDWVRSVRLCEGHFPGSRIGGTALRNLHAAPLIGGDSG